VTGGRVTGGRVTGGRVTGGRVVVGLEVVLDGDARPDPLLQAPQITTRTRAEK
jgi:hypothetical protein